MSAWTEPAGLMSWMLSLGLTAPAGLSFSASPPVGAMGSAVQGTRPQTLAYGMNDSPAGMCAWLLEKRRGWSDCHGDVEQSFSKDDLLTSMTIYWATESFGTAARFYAEARRQPWAPSHDRRPVVEAPTAVLLFDKDIMKLPRQWAESYYNLKRWNVVLHGGHFVPMETPDVLIEDVRDFFRGLR